MKFQVIEKDVAVDVVKERRVKMSIIVSTIMLMASSIF